MTDRDAANAPAAALEQTHFAGTPLPPTAMAWLIVVSTGDQFGTLWRIGHKPFVIGRGTDCNLQVSERTVSRHHARIRAAVRDTGVQYTLYDLATANGTFVNGGRIASTHVLANHDVILIGYTRMVFRCLS